MNPYYLLFILEDCELCNFTLAYKLIIVRQVDGTSVSTSTTRF